VSTSTPFAHPVERELARIFDEVGIRWEYEPTTFVLERNPDGTVREAFTPDFYLPEQEMYVECTTMRQKLTNGKNRKVRKLREQGVLVTVLYRRDFERLRERHGFPFESTGTGH
jgi:hypoxanthine phosphoribosyltransferase